MLAIGARRAYGANAMLNNIAIYQDAGRKAARAMNNDQSEEFKFHYDHTRRMLTLETIADRQTARAAYDQAYLAIRHQFIVR
jgi:hypothetical protein